QLPNGGNRSTALAVCRRRISDDSLRRPELGTGSLADDRLPAASCCSVHAQRPRSRGTRATTKCRRQRSVAEGISDAGQSINRARQRLAFTAQGLQMANQDTKYPKDVIVLLANPSAEEI